MCSRERREPPVARGTQHVWPVDPLKAGNVQDGGEDLRVESSGKAQSERQRSDSKKKKERKKKKKKGREGDQREQSQS